MSVLAGGVTRGFTYSATGNVTVDDLAGTATNLTYNTADRLVKISAGGITLVDYVYSATGQRAIKATPGATTHYLHDPGGALYAETDGAGTVLREYITLGGATIAIIDAMGTSFVHNDHLATPQVMTDGTAAVVWDASYRPFGEASIAGAAANQQRFPGQTADAESGYSDNWYRTYDTSLGRYLQSDPIGIMAGFNTYAYADGNPVMNMDPTGEFVPVLFFVAQGVGWGLTAWSVYDFGSTWYGNYRSGGCRDIWGARPEISAWDVAFLLAGPTARVGKVFYNSGKIIYNSGKLAKWAKKWRNNRHHSDPDFLGGADVRTNILEWRHQRLHKRLNDFLRQRTNSAGQHMRPQRGNAGDVIRRNFSRQERLEALRDFYRGPGRLWYRKAARDFFAQHPGL